MSEQPAQPAEPTIDTHRHDPADPAHAEPPAGAVPEARPRTRRQAQQGENREIQHG